MSAPIVAGRESPEGGKRGRGSRPSSLNMCIHMNESLDQAKADGRIAACGRWISSQRDDSACPTWLPGSSARCCRSSGFGPRDCES
jgi:hypothetical protein